MVQLTGLAPILLKLFYYIALTGQIQCSVQRLHRSRVKYAPPDVGGPGGHVAVGFSFRPKDSGRPYIAPQVKIFWVKIFWV